MALMTELFIFFELLSGFWRQVFWHLNLHGDVLISEDRRILHRDDTFSF